MPIYEYECPNCGSRFDRRAPIDAPDPACARCGAERVRRLISLFASTGGTSSPSQPKASAMGGGCCGGSCACGAR